ncbi:MAG: sulfotransferase [Hyphomicrobiales bacterium]|nr:sulfotransferase [Hyphomicrobiales bacterium]
MRQKVFLIGLHKTGTMSLGRAIKMLGYKLCPRPPIRFNKLGGAKLDPPYTVERMAPELVKIAASGRYDAFRNYPWSVCYREMYAAFPDSKFILARRNPQTWIKSVVSHFGERQGRGSRFLYGENTPAKGNESHYIDRYERHNAEAIAFFADKPGSLLVFDLETAGWDELCAFLGRRKPLFRDYPHRNQGGMRGKSRIAKVLSYNISEIRNALRWKSRA